MNRETLVYADLEGISTLVGYLWTRVRNGRESTSFQYAQNWLNSRSRFPLEPALMLGKDPHHMGAGKSLFGALGDSAPDRWGRMLIRRAERRNATREGRAPRSLFEI